MGKSKKSTKSLHPNHQLQEKQMEIPPPTRGKIDENTTTNLRKNRWEYHHQQEEKTD